MDNYKIEQNIYCEKCLRSFSKTNNIQVGFTKNGIQIWCNNCDESVIEINPNLRIERKNRFQELQDEIMYCGEIYNDSNWENYNEYHKLID